MRDKEQVSHAELNNLGEFSAPKERKHDSSLLDSCCPQWRPPKSTAENGCGGARVSLKWGTMTKSIRQSRPTSIVKSCDHIGLLIEYDVIFL
jgi:hypothetical protein